MRLKVRLLEIEQGQNEIVLNEDEAKEATIDIGDRVLVRKNGVEIIAMVDYSHAFIQRGYVGVFHEVARSLGLRDGDVVDIALTDKPRTLEFIRKKIDGKTLTKEEIFQLIRDMAEERLSSSELSSWVSAVCTRGLSPHETAALTQAMVQSGETITWPRGPVVSEHSIGGPAGDRVSMLIVPIIASLGILMPKTASRAISSGCATADAMEVLAPTALSVDAIKRVVLETNGCIVWGGAVNLAPVDDRLIRIRMPLRLDPRGLVLSSILAKKKAEGAELVLLDIPYGRGAKVVDLDEARSLANDFKVLAFHLGMRFECIVSDGSRPMLNQIGPVLEARAVLEALRGSGHALLVEKACLMASVILSMVHGMTREEGLRMARRQLESGAAERKMREIIAAQGGDPGVKPEELPIGEYRHVIEARDAGRVAHIDNGAIARIARSLGAPADKGAGLVLYKNKGEFVEVGEPLFELIAMKEEKLSWAVEEAKRWPIYEIERIIIEFV